mmetsp:Transcript_21592/g.55262  ORF Transcript_21592/g.55262 Transcript_21592/m.55262 type:complete len:202 (-) Transcript_21592:70-675(-)
MHKQQHGGHAVPAQPLPDHVVLLLRENRPQIHTQAGAGVEQPVQRLSPQGPPPLQAHGDVHSHEDRAARIQVVAQHHHPLRTQVQLQGEGHHHDQRSEAQPGGALADVRPGAQYGALLSAAEVGSVSDQLFEVVADQLVRPRKPRGQHGDAASDDLGVGVLHVLEHKVLRPGEELAIVRLDAVRGGEVVVVREGQLNEIHH